MQIANRQVLRGANWKNRLTSPAAALGIGLLAAIVLALLPARWTGAMRHTAQALLRPGQRAALGVRREGNRATTWVKSHFQTAAQLAETEGEIQRLKQENRRLAAELAAARTQPAKASADHTDDAEPLLLAQCVPALVLGRQARAFLGRHHLLDLGSSEGVQPEALVVAWPALIDRGGDSDIRPGQLVLSGRRVWGKIVELGSHTSVVRPVTEPGYRDVVQLGDSCGPQGILEGTGEALARIRLVEVTEPVSLGDPVYATAAKGVLPAPLLYGRIVRLDRPVGAAHWEIWMQPAVADEPERVGVLRMELNPLRVAGKKTIARE